MKLPAFVLAATLLSLSTGAVAQTDCYRPLKDMLQGTIDLEAEVNNGKTETSSDGSSSCTLATRLAGPDASVTI